jgi:hypothetical protein
MVGFAHRFRPMYAQANMGHPSLTWTAFADVRGSVVDFGRRYLGYGVGWSAPARERKGNSTFDLCRFFGH